MSALSQLEIRGAGLVDFLDALSSLDWATRFSAPFVLGAEIQEYDKADFKRALSNRSTSRTPAYNGLFIIAVTNFELFVKEFIDEILGRKARKAKTFGELDRAFQDNYMSSVGKIIAGKSSGVVSGVPYTKFSEVALTFSNSYLGTSPFSLMGDVFTLVMGNPTWERLEKLLQTVGVEDPMGKELASTDILKAHFDNAKWTEVVSKAKKFHENAIRQRNTIVHNVIPLSLVEKDVRASVTFFYAFAAGLDEVVRAQI